MYLKCLEIFYTTHEYGLRNNIISIRSCTHVPTTVLSVAGQFYYSYASNK